MTLTEHMCFVPSRLRLLPLASALKHLVQHPVRVHPVALEVKPQDTLAQRLPCGSALKVEQVRRGDEAPHHHWPSVATSCGSVISPNRRAASTSATCAQHSWQPQSALCAP